MHKRQSGSKVEDPLKNGKKKPYFAWLDLSKVSSRALAYNKKKCE